MTTNWVTAKEGEVPAGAIEAGHDDVGALYICRADYERGTHPGKIRTGFGGCRITWNGQEVTIPHYEVLVETSAASPHPCSAVIRRVFELTDWVEGLTFTSSISHEQEELRHWAEEIQDLAIDCGCIPLADTANRLAELAADPFTDADILHDQVRIVKRATEHCA